ncbi:MAG: response regulator [Treponema sp.]|nr:response regulator [Treponema sp.]MCL2251915.1 response regulator [Treponema sp.]
MDGSIKHSLLIIDDDVLNHKVLTHILGQEYIIYTAENGLSGIDKALQFKPDLILLDIIMPGMDGFATFAEIRKTEELKKTPIVFITALDDDDIDKMNFFPEADDYIIKPFKSVIVKTRIRNLLFLKTAIKNVENANRSKYVFLAKMSHDIRSPLYSILENASNNLHNGDSSDSIREAFSKIYNSGDYMLGIINDIVDMSQIEEGKLMLAEAPYEISGLIGDIIAINMLKYEKKPVEFFLKIDKKIPSHLLGDEIRIKHILNNLLSNAFKYTSSGEVELSVSLEKMQPAKNNQSVMIVFRVRDTGQGMVEEQLAVFKSDKPSNEEIKLNDISSLSINVLIELVKLMNGEIMAKSEPGAGTVITVRLPQLIAGDSNVLGTEGVDKLMKFRSNQESKTDKTTAELEPVPFGKILVVDDIDINQYVIKEMLSFYGMDIDLASSGEEAINKILLASTQSVKYDLIFMDYQMPVMDGIATVKKIRKLKCADGLNYKKTPIIALTAASISMTRYFAANADKIIKKRFLSNGFSDYIAKPIDLQKLDELLRKWLIQENDTARGKSQRVRSMLADSGCNKK